MRQLVVNGRVACLLLPTHAHQVAVCLERTDPTIALIVIMADQTMVDWFQRCVDFTTYAGRLFFAINDGELRVLFTNNPGLPIPQQFVRLPVTDPALSEQVIVWAQKVFSDVATLQSQRAATAKQAWSLQSRKPLVVTSTRFALWDDAGDQLADALDADVIDTADATQSATAYIAEKAQHAPAVITANVGRADHPDLICTAQPWISWITTGRVPKFITSSPRDGLVLIDEKLVPIAINLGWPRERLRIGYVVRAVQPASDRKTLAIITDLPDLSAPKDIEEFSSWRVVWDAIRKDLPENPHRLAGDIEGYLEKSRKFFGVPATDFPREIFVERLIAPAYLLGVAKWLVNEKLPVEIHGSGWDKVESVRHQYRGTIETREKLVAVLSRSAGVIDAFIATVHLLRHCGVTTIATLGRTPQRIAQDIRNLLNGSTTTPCLHATTLAAAIGELTSDINRSK